MNINESRRGLRWRFVIALFAAAFFLLFIDTSGQLGDPWRLLRDPVATLSGRFSGLSSVLRRPADLATAQAEIAALRERLSVVERENEQLRSAQADYQRLVELFERVAAAPNYQRVPANVIGWAPNPLFRDLIIDRGANDGIRVGMPVEAARGLVGQVYRTTPNSAQIILISDAQSFIPVRLSQSRAVGILGGGGAGGLMTLRWIDLEAQVLPNEIVVTSGLQGQSPQEIIANRFPPDIIVGRVLEVRRSEAELFQEAIIQPAIDFNALETVLVITDFTPVNVNVFDDSQP